MMKKLIGAVSLALLCCNTFQAKAQRSLFAQKPSWSDEFNYTGLPDSSKWSFDIGTGHNGWGNQELQYYTKERGNIEVKNGVLKITAKKEAKEQASYTSAKIHARGKGDFLYGRIEARAQVPQQRGTWPAIWMMPTTSKYGGWPKSGEIDIMEHVGYDVNTIHSTVHTGAFNHIKNTHKSGTKFIKDAIHNFQVYAVEWTPEFIKGYINEELIFTFENLQQSSEEWPFDHPFYPIINLAIGGSWGGKMGIDDAHMPAEFLVDYIRYYPYIGGNK